MAARFNEDGFNGNIAIAETGTSAGFERFCKEGSTDISNASRAIKDSKWPTARPLAAKCSNS